MSAHRFKVGERVVAIETNNDGTIIKGNIYTVHGLTCCPKCGVPCITIEEYPYMYGTKCSCCGNFSYDHQCRFKESRFAPLQSTSEAREYKMKVSIPELLTIKEYQEQ